MPLKEWEQEAEESSIWNSMKGVPMRQETMLDTMLVQVPTGFQLETGY